MGVANLGDLLMILACALGWAKGDRAERAGSLLLFVTWIGTAAARRIAPHLAPPRDVEELKALLNLVGDFTLAGGLLILAIRYSSLWLGGVLLLQGAAMTLHSLFLDNESSPYAYYVVYNVICFSFLPMILGATLSSWRRRILSRKASERAPPAYALPLVGDLTLSPAT